MPPGISRGKSQHPGKPRHVCLIGPSPPVQQPPHHGAGIFSQPCSLARGAQVCLGNRSRGVHVLPTTLHTGGQPARRAANLSACNAAGDTMLLETQRCPDMLWARALLAREKFCSSDSPRVRLLELARKADVHRQIHASGHFDFYLPVPRKLRLRLKRHLCRGGHHSISVAVQAQSNSELDACMCARASMNHLPTQHALPTPLASRVSPTKVPDKALQWQH